MASTQQMFETKPSGESPPHDHLAFTKTENSGRSWAYIEPCYVYVRHTLYFPAENFYFKRNVENQWARFSSPRYVCKWSCCSNTHHLFASPALHASLCPPPNFAINV